MRRKIVHIVLLVHDYDEAIKFYTEKLEFELIEDTVLSAEKRWVLIKPDTESECSVLLAKACGKTNNGKKPKSLNGWGNLPLKAMEKLEFLLNMKSPSTKKVF